MADESLLPLRGVVLCCTSLPPEERSRLSVIAEQMGASHKHDLTSEVTHMLVGELDTPKYKFVARERSDVKVLLPSWIDAVRLSWLEGEQIDVTASEAQHALPVFYGLKVCITGFEDLPFRTRVEEVIRSNGGVWSGNLTKDVTHLIARGPTGQKYEYASRWDTKIVTIEWVDQSLERGMILEEGLYHPLTHPSERGHGAWVRRAPQPAPSTKRAREPDAGSQGSRKLRRTASARFEADNSGLWMDIVTGKETPEGAPEDQWDETRPRPLKHEVPTETSWRRSDDLRVQDRPLRPREIPDVNPYVDAAAESNGIFQNRSFSVHGFDEAKTTVATKHLYSHGAQVVDQTSTGGDVDFVLTPHTMSATQARTIGDRYPGSESVTDLWIERCLHLKRFESPEMAVTSRPIPIFPMPGFEGLKISWTGFQGIELLHISKMVKLLGSSYLEDFSSQSSLLICNDKGASVEKLQHAALWNTPAVTIDWFWNSIKTGEKLAFDSYLLQPVSRRPKSDPSQNSRAPTEPSSRSLVHDGSAIIQEPQQRQQSARANSGVTRAGSKADGDTRPDKARPEKKSRADQCPFPDESGPNLPDNDDHGDDFAPPPQSPAPASPATAPKRAPLQERSPNPSPPKEVVPRAASTKAASMSLNSKEDNDPLGPAITSLLEHHQKQKQQLASKSVSVSPVKSGSAVTPSGAHQPSDNQNPIRRRRRQLYGRAPSNLSSHSHSYSLEPNKQSRNGTRASSIDTTHTDDLGTPLQNSATNASSSTNHRPPSTLDNNNPNDQTTNIGNDYGTSKDSFPHQPSDLPKSIRSLPFMADDADDDANDPDKPNDDHLQMTQLGYEDPDVKAWRERVAMKLERPASGKAAGAVVAEGAGVTGKAGNTTVAAGQVSASGGLGISKRTRLATAAVAAGTGR